MASQAGRRIIDGVFPLKAHNVSSKTSITLNPLPCKEKRPLSPTVLMLPEKIVPQEGINASVEHGVHIAAFGTGAMVLDQPVGLKRVGAYLTAEGNGVLAGVVGLTGGVAPALFQSVQTRLEHAHGAFAVALLRTLVLALNDYAGWNVRDAHGRLRLVDVLTARA